MSAYNINFTAVSVSITKALTLLMHTREPSTSNRCSHIIETSFAMIASVLPSSTRRPLPKVARCCLKLSSPLTFAVLLVLRPDEWWVLSGLELALPMQDCGAGQHSSAHVPTVRIHLVSYMIISAASRSGLWDVFLQAPFCQHQFGPSL